MTYPVGSSPTILASTVAAVMATVTAGTLYTKLTSTTRCDKRQGKDEPKRQTSDGHFRIESHLMDKIQQKKYLTSAKEGIPSTLRILAIDLKEVRTDAFTGHCRLSHDKVFLDEVAPPKEIYIGTDVGGNVKHNKNTTKGKRDAQSRLTIPQKALVKSLVLCSSPDSQQSHGVELLEASVADLNRFKLRKTHSLGSYSYDPGKYFDSGGAPPQKPKRNKDKSGGAAGGDEKNNGVVPSISSSTGSDNDALVTEIEAPWNQYSWMEEMRIRINGQVNFDAPLEQSSTYRRLLFGNVYKVTVPAVSTIWDIFLPPFARSDPDGVDGRNRANVRASNKPHAVIANGAALQTVPGSLRLLQKLCKKADVPLFIVHDPRGWGGNTHDNLEEALRDMRSSIKNRVISNALKQQGSSAFTRGRLLGQIETETKWQIRDKKRITKEVLALDGGRRRKPEKRDWSSCDVADLEKKLIDRKVIQVVTNSMGDDSDNVEAGRSYTPAMAEIAKKCVEDLKLSTSFQSDKDTSESTNLPQAMAGSMTPIS